ADREALTPPTTGGGGAPPGGIPGIDGPDGGGGPPVSPPAPGAPPLPGPAAPPPARVPIPSLTREYKDDFTDRRYDVRAFFVDGSDPDLPNPQTAWALRVAPDGHFEFLANPDHAAFRSATLTPLDALLTELAVMAHDFTRGGTQRRPPFAQLLTG